MQIRRAGYATRLKETLRVFPAAVVLGPRQVGKSTLVRDFARRARGRITYFDLERPSELEHLAQGAEQDLALIHSEPGLVCIDEVQRLPSLFPLLRVLLDDPKRRARYVLLGSASPDLVAGASETLAGRVGFLDLTPLLAREVAADTHARRVKLWARGGFPRSYLPRRDSDSLAWREEYIRTFLERDVPVLGLKLPAPAVRRFWTMLAHLHGGLLNASEIGSGLGVSAPTVTRWLDVLEGTFLVRRLSPWWANIGKRLVKAPKIYVRDTGLLHALLGIEGPESLRAHPKAGASWEGWAIEQILGALSLIGERVEAHFWRTHGGAEVDLLLRLRGQLVPVEIKLAGVARPTRGLVECVKDLGLARGFVLHPGERAHSLGDGLRALPVSLVARPALLLAELLGQRNAP